MAAGAAAGEGDRAMEPPALGEECRRFAYRLLAVVWVTLGAVGRLLPTGTVWVTFEFVYRYLSR